MTTVHKLFEKFVQLRKVSSISGLFLATHNKKGGLKGSIYIFLKLSGQSGFKDIFLSSFRGDCILSATFLINMLPKSVLNGKTLNKLLLGKAPNYIVL